MAGSSFNLQSLLPQRRPLEAFQNAVTDPEAFSASCIWFIIFFGVVAFVWVLIQWVRVWLKTSAIRKGLNGLTFSAVSEQRQRLRDRGDSLWLEFDSSLVEDHDIVNSRIWLRRTVDAEQVYNERSLARGLINSRWVSAVPGLLTALGVLGAFIGLQQGISGLKFVNPQPGEMEASIQTLVNGLTIKFSSSIWGIACSIAFNVLEKFVEGFASGHIRSVQTRIDGLFARYTPETALSRLQISSVESEKILRGLAAAIGGQMQQALAQVGQFTSQAIGEAMKPAVDKLADAAEHMKNELSAGSSEALANGIAAAANNLETSLNSVGNRYNEQFVSLSSQLTAAFSALQSPVTALGGALSKQDTALADAVRRLEAHADVASSFTQAAVTMQTAAEGLVKLRSSWERAASQNESAASAQERAAGSNDRVATQLMDVSDNLNEFRSAIEAGVQVVGNIGTPMQNLRTILENIPADFRAIEGIRSKGDIERGEQLQAITKELSDTIRKTADQLAGHGKVAEELRNAATQMSESTKSMQSFSTHVREAASNHERAAAASENAAHSNAQVAASLKHGVNLSADLSAAFSALQAPVTALSGTLSKQDTALADAVKRLEAHGDLAASLSAAALTMESAVEGLKSFKSSWEQSASRNESAASAQERAAGSNELVAARLTDVSANLEEFRQVVEDGMRVVGTLGEPMGKLTVILEKIPEDFQKIEGKRSKGDIARGEQMQTITKELADTIGKAAEQLSGHGKVAEELRNAAKQMAESSKNLHSFSTLIREAASSHEKAATASESVAQSNAKIAASLKLVPEKIDGVSAGLMSAAESVRQSSNDAGKNYSDAANQQNRFVQKLADGLGNFAKKISEALASYGDDVQAQTRERIQLFTKETNAILKQLASLEMELKNDLEATDALAQRLLEENE